MIRNTFTYLASTIVALHLLIPHAHCEELTTKDHDAFHEQQEGTLIDYLSFIFHEYTDDGDMEHFVADNDDDDVQFEHGILPPSFAPFQSSEFSKTPYTTYGSPQVEHRQSGFISAWGNRPPPLI